jgi:hypothetical protein
VVAGAWRPYGTGEIDRLILSDVNLYPGFGGDPQDSAGQVVGINSGGSAGPTTTLPAETVTQ